VERIKKPQGFFFWLLRAAAAHCEQVSALVQLRCRDLFKQVRIFARASGTGNLHKNRPKFG
jgi:hypothetical protein